MSFKKRNSEYNNTPPTYHNSVKRMILSFYHNIREELKIILEMMLVLFKDNAQSELSILIENLSDIFDNLNKLIKFIPLKRSWGLEKAYIERNFAMCIKTNECNLKYSIISLIVDNLMDLQGKLHHYFPNIDTKNYDWIRNHSSQ
ncbi:hypothetical protein A3Q56_03792 [Intoshia linei]|uniref:Uncharacterized protein n=1 Tax=Intoshia linei TaxID=1819745 RepID=A0A177B2K2_9BILA|nr:hypothetical protein A3Q56_03792 [Intoshia linei]